MQKGPTDQLFGLYFLITYGCETSQLYSNPCSAGDQRDLWMAAISIASAYKPKDPVAGGVGPVAPDVPPEGSWIHGLTDSSISTEKNVESNFQLWNRDAPGSLSYHVRTMSVRSVSEQKTSRGTVGRTSESSESRVSGQQRWVELGGYTQ